MAKGIQSISLGFRLLRTLTDSDEPLPLKTLALASAMSPSKARMYLISLVETGLVAQSPQTGLYALGPYALHLGTRALQRIDSRDVMSDAVRSLQQKTRALVLLCHWQASGIVIVAAEEGPEPSPLQWRIGGSAPISSTATGVVFLAFGPRKAVRKQLATELQDSRLSLPAQRKRTRELEAAAAEAGVRGIAEADPVVFAAGVSISGFAAVAVPVFNARKQLRYVLTVLYRTDRPRHDQAAMANHALRAASVGSMLSDAD